MSGIFISYRRQDTAYIAGRLHDELSRQFGADRIFRDVDTIAPGVDFVKRIDDAVASSDALLAVIGDDWLTTTDPKGRRRIDNPRDWVRLEIVAALKRKILVVPLLVEGATMPKPEELPPSLRSLARYNALELTDGRWDYDTARLIEALKPVVSPSRSRLRPGEKPAMSRPWPPAATKVPPPAPPVSLQARAAPSPPRTPTEAPAADQPPATSAESVSTSAAAGQSAPSDRRWADYSSSPPPAPPTRRAPSGPRPHSPSPPPVVAQRFLLPTWVKFGVPAALVALVASVLAIVVLVPKEDSAAPSAAPPTTGAPSTVPDDPERPYPFASSPGGPIRVGAKTIPRAEVEGVVAATAVPMDQLLGFAGELALSKRARNQLQFVVNRLGPPATSTVELVAVAGASWEEDPSRPPADRRVLRVGALLRNGYTRSAADPKLDSRLYCREQPDGASRDEKLVAQSQFELRTSEGFPLIPPFGTVYVELQYQPTDLPDPAVDVQRYPFCRFEPARLSA